MQDFEIKFRKLSEIESFDGVTPEVGDRLWIDEYYKAALRSNPFLPSPDAACQKVGYVDGKVGGTEIQIPILMKLEDREYQAGTGSMTGVDPWARKSGLGLSISDVDLMDPSYACVMGEGAGLSQIAVRVHKFTGFTVFEYPRFVVLWNSRSVIERHVKGLLGKIASWLVNIPIVLYALALRFLAMWYLREVEIEEVSPEDEKALCVLEGLANDGNCFAEVHDRRWFKWTLSHSFSKNGPARAFVVRRKRDASPLAFYMTKRRFHEQASGRGFRNVWLGSIIEWGCAPGSEKILQWAIATAAAQFRSSTDAVEFPTDDPALQKFARRLLWRPVGCANFAFKLTGVANMSPSIHDHTHWRLRPAMGDCGLN